jgi:predicted enzyme related to lactoylglutathione lyase
MARPVVARFEVTGKDSAGLRRFYSELFGWSIQEGAKWSGFGVVPQADGGISGVIGPDRSGGPGHVTFYVLSVSRDVGHDTAVPTNLCVDGLETLRR